ncbi:MAG TPA: preprotein translocase subunit YajC [Kofleriaceae bacterium]|nr:preprotein translocase subunit YajC [Kofleriaceae bacterium]
MQGAVAFLPLILIFGVFYLMIIRPQTKRQKEQQEMIAKLGKGEQIITRGGIIGTITGVQDDVLVVEIQEKVRVRIPRSYVEGKWTSAAARAARDGGEPKAA